jgi:hypothetical protein
MTPKLLRLIFVCEFLLALVAIFTAWSVFGGQGALDVMYWAWKLGFGIALALAIVALTAALIAEDAILTLRTARWLAAIIALVAAMGALTYYYSFQEDNGDSEETGTISSVHNRPLASETAAIGLETTKVSPIRGL